MGGLVDKVLAELGLGCGWYECVGLGVYISGYGWSGAYPSAPARQAVNTTYGHIMQDLPFFSAAAAGVATAGALCWATRPADRPGACEGCDGRKGGYTDCGGL